MCTLAVYVEPSPTTPLVVAANRDEFLDRPATTPELLAVSPRIVGGRDLRANGTWLGISEHGLCAGLLNRRTDTAPDATKRSRGLLLMDVLGAPSAATAAERLAAVDPSAYNAFNLLVADRRGAWVVQNRPHAMQLTALAPGVHVLSNLDLNDPECPKIAHSHRLFADAGALFGADADRGRLRRALAEILADHTTALDPRRPDTLGALCVHADGFGTRCSSLVFLSADGGWEHWFADGPPCSAPYRPAATP